MKLNPLRDELTVLLRHVNDEYVSQVANWFAELVARDGLTPSAAADEIRDSAIPEVWK